MIDIDPEIYDAALRKVIRKNQLAIDQLTEDQFVSALRQALKSGDFTRYIVASNNHQTVTYLPYRREQQLMLEIIGLKERIGELENS